MAPIDLVSFAIEFNKIMRWNSQALYKKLLFYKEGWKGAVQQAADLYKEVAVRKIAQYQQEKSELEAKQEMQKAQRRKDRELLLNRAFDR
jgi:hypothetical protein